MLKNAKPAQLTEAQFDQVKSQLVPVMGRMTRLQIFEMADFLYAEARNRDTPGLRDDWKFEVRV